MGVPMGTPKDRQSRLVGRFEMYGAIDSGALEIKEPRTPETTTPTTLTAWTRDVMKPMVG